MGKPLLTDEMIAEAQREADWEKRLTVKAPLKAKKFGQSRRLASVRRGGFYSKLNLLLMLVFLLLVALIYAVFRL